MAIAVSHLSTQLQHPLGQATILYPGKGSVWQPVATTFHSPPPVVDLPKEVTIASDFTTTSVIARRRLSSKKRKKLESQQQNGTSGSESGTVNNSSSLCSPGSSVNGSPAVTSTTSTPPPNDRIGRIPTTHEPFQKSSTSFQPVTTSQQQQHDIKFGGASREQFVSMAGPSGYIPAISAAQPVRMVPEQFANPMFGHLQQELNYRYLHEQNGSHAAGPGGVILPPHHMPQVVHPQPTTTAINNGQRDASRENTTVSEAKNNTFKWCSAHIVIAKQIQQHQQQHTQTGVGMAPPPCSLTQEASSSSLNLTSYTKPHHHNTQQPSHVETSLAMAQQLALLQMYGAQPTGYMAVPYSTVQDVQMRMFQLAQAGHIQALPNTSISMVKPSINDTTSMSLNSLPMVNGLHVQPQAVAAAGPPFATQTVPVAAVAPSDLNCALMQGGLAASGSWVAPGVPVFGSCIVNNPLQPGYVAAPWVK